MLTITERSTHLIEEAVEEQLGISILEARALQRLAEVGEPLRMRNLSRQLQLSGATTTRTVDQLAKQAYVQRLASPSDNKAVYVALTEQGQEFAAQVQHTIDRPLFAPYSSSPVRSLVISSVRHESSTGAGRPFGFPTSSINSTEKIRLLKELEKKQSLHRYINALSLSSTSIPIQSPWAHIFLVG